MKTLEKLRQSPAVKQLLGEPIKDGWFPAGSVNSGEGEARIYLKVHGPKTADGHEPKADVNVQARLVTGTWGFTQFDVIPDGGQRLNLMPEISAGDTPDVPLFNGNTTPPPSPAKTDATPPPDVDIKIPDLPSDSGGK